MSDKLSGERLEFLGFSNVTIEHLHRYAFANDYVKGKKVLDIASGEGYGAFILSKRAQFVFGVDIDFETIEDSKLKYVSNNLEFIQGSVTKIPLEDNSIDIVVSFETLEHHDMHDQMLIEIKRVLKINGILIMSSPDKAYYSDKIGQNNPFHIKELYFNEFKDLTKRHFKYSSFLFQNSFNYNSFIAADSNFNVDIYSGNNKNVFKGKIEPLYNIVLASNKIQVNSKPSFFDGSIMFDFFMEIKMVALKEECFDYIYNTTSYKVGNIICRPFFALKRALKRLKV